MGDIVTTTVPASARVLVRREDPEDLGQRQIYVRVDDGPTQTLRYGQSTAVDIAPGPHSLKANNTLFWKTVGFEAAPGEEVEFRVVNKAGRLGLGLLALLGVGLLILVVEVVERRPIATDRS